MKNQNTTPTQSSMVKNEQKRKVNVHVEWDRLRQGQFPSNRLKDWFGDSYCDSSIIPSNKPKSSLFVDEWEVTFEVESEVSREYVYFTLGYLLGQHVMADLCK